MFSLAHLDTLRKAELERVAAWLPAGARVLEVGAGTGRQAAELVRLGFSVEAVDLSGSNYTAERVFPITDYDGRHVPFPDAWFDIVFSSSVLEHVPDLHQLHSEIARVLRPGGRAVHVVPVPAWRWWTMVSAFPAGVQLALSRRAELAPRRPFAAVEARRLLRAWARIAVNLGEALYQRRHGERGCTISELWLFRAAWWRRNFRENGFEIVRETPMGLFYTGNMVFGERWSIARRVRLARRLGSATRLFELRVAGGTEIVAGSRDQAMGEPR